MAITSITRYFSDDPNTVGIITTDNLTAITTAGYWSSTAIQNEVILLNNGVFTFLPTDIVLIAYSGGIGFFIFDSVNQTFIQWNTIISGLVTVTYGTASATPGTIRTIYGKMVDTASTITSGNLVGVRGEVDYVSASGGFFYGTQGKIIPTGTLSGSSWNIGVFGQVDISAATINAGQIAPIWGDYGATSGTLTNETGMYGIAMTNTTAAVLAGQLYLYGGATNLMLLNTNAGLSGVTYFKDSGTGAGSWGNATPPTPSKVLQISVDGTLYYLPLVAQNS